MATMEEGFVELREAIRNLGRELQKELPSLVVLVALVWTTLIAAFVALRLF